MLIFLDTEFTDFIDCELISIGLVSEDGQHAFYAEVEDFDRAKCIPYVQSGIWPLLGKIPDAIMKRAELAQRLRTWFTGLPCSVTIACDSYTVGSCWLMCSMAICRRRLPGAMIYAH